MRLLVADRYRSIAEIVRDAHADPDPWVGATFPGCRRPAAQCEIDHEIDWALGGTTNSDDLDPKCGGHHHLRHDSEWACHRDPDTGRPFCTSPTGHVCDEDPPPW